MRSCGCWNVTDIPGRFDLDVGCAIDLLVAVVRDRGCGYVDPPIWVNGDEYLSCIYAYAGEPRCIVGEVFSRAGVSVAALELTRRRKKSSRICMKRIGFLCA